MKPLPPAPLTDEDLNLLVGLTQRRALRFGMWINERSIASDRRDADLMLHAQRHKLVAALLRTDDGSRIDVRLGAGIHVGHLGLTLPAR
jgi:hypothetical protein